MSVESKSVPSLQRICRFEQMEEIKAFAKKFELFQDDNPYFIPHDSVLKDTSLIGGKEVLNFASYNYLGLSGDPVTVRAGQEALALYGSSASGSRVLTGEKTLFQDLEQEIAAWKGVEDAIVLVSGNATNTTFVGNFCNKKDLILYDMFSHDSIAQGLRLSQCDTKAFRHNDAAALERILKRSRDSYEKVLIVIEGAYSMDGDIAPVPDFVEIKKKYGCFLMVDEAHSMGVIGAHGKGVQEYFNLKEDDVDIYMGTLSKALGACGGYLAGRKSLIEYLRYSLPGFVFSVGISPVLAAVALAGIRELKKDTTRVQRLHHNIELFGRRARALGFHTCLSHDTAIIPILVGDDALSMKICKKLLDKGVFVVPAIYPAVPRGQSRLRFCVTSDHKDDQIIYALHALKELCSELDIVLPSLES